MKYLSHFARPAWLALVLTPWLTPQVRPAHSPPGETDLKFPNGKSQQEEILKADHQRDLKEANEIIELAEELKKELEKNDRHVLSISSVKKTEEIEKLAKRIHSRLVR